MTMCAYARLLALVAVVLTPSTPAAAQTQANCDWYAMTAVRQQQINEERKCGLTGEAWHKVLAQHLKWCGSVAPEVWKAQAQQRNRQLDDCAKR